MKRVLMLCLAVMYCLGQTRAQDAAADFKKINQAYAAKAIMADVTVKVFDSWTATKASTEKKGQLKKWNGFHYYALGDMVTISAPSSYLAVDHAKKTIFLSSRTEAEAGFDLTSLDKQLPQLLKACKQVTYAKDGKNMASYLLVYKGNGFEKIRISFDTRTFLLTRIEVFSTVQDGKEVVGNRLKQPRMELSFQHAKTGVKLSEGDFSYNSYLELKGKTWIKRKAYQQYQFINQLASGK